MKTADFIRHEMNRRQFLGSSAKNAAGVAAGVAAGMVGLGSAAAKAAPGERVTVGVIGVRSQGKSLAATMASLPEVDVRAVCDIDEGQLPSVIRVVEEAQGARPRAERDFRRVLDDPAIDAVVIATPDHWHAMMTILACQAGKDVYVEKPVSHNIAEGERMLAAARKHQRVVQSGLQQRSGAHFQSAVEQVRSGRLGQVNLAKAWIVHRRKPIGFKKDAQAPEGVDYDLWLGPAPQRPFNPNRFHHNWHWFWDYGTGELGNWGVHLLDVARWGLNVELPTRVTATGGKYYFHDDQETPDTQIVTYDYPTANRSQGPGKTIVWEHRLWHTHGIEGRSAAVAFYGENGTLVVDRGGWKIYDSREPLTSDSSEQARAHCQNFIDCVRTRGAPTADLEIGCTSSALCHLGNIAQRLGRQVQFDPATMTFGADEEAGRLLTREYRAPWQLPAV